MVKKCIYCHCAISDESVIDFCKVCGVGVWGEKMFNAILKNMEDANERGDLCLNHETSEDVDQKAKR